MPEVEPAVVEELVGNAHGNLARVRELLDQHPKALKMRAPWNETAVEAATQMGNQPILELLIERGAPVDFFSACVLGRVEQVDAELAADRGRASARGVHDLRSTSPRSEATSRSPNACWRRAPTSTHAASPRRRYTAR